MSINKDSMEKEAKIIEILNKVQNGELSQKEALEKILALFNELVANICEWYDGEEMPCDSENELSH